MRIAIDARWIFEELSGIGQYTTELIKHLAKIDRDNEYILLFDQPWLMDRTAQTSQYNTAPNVEARLVNCGALSLKNQLLGSRVLEPLRADVFHSPNYMIPLRAFPVAKPHQPKCVVTLHDVIPLVFPDHAPRSKKRRLFPIYKRVMYEVGQRADAILTVSESSRNDVIQHLHIDPERRQNVRVVYNGVSDTYKPPFQLPDRRTKTILFVGRMDPYKNVVALIEAFARIRTDDLEKVRLKIIGPTETRYPEAPARAAELGLDDAIDWMGYAQNDDILRAYQEADLFVLPSRYEGFGLPVLEAMACGIPVICSNTSSLPEVAGEAAIQVGPDDIQGLADAIANVLRDPVLANRMRDRGLEQAKKFSWRKCAEETLAVYEEVNETS